MSTKQYQQNNYDADKEKVKKASASSADSTSLAMGVFLLMKSALGIGMLYLHSAYSLTGWAEGILIMLIVSLFSACSLYFLGRSSSRTGIDSYYGLGKLSLGKVGEQLAVFATMLYLLGALIAYSTFAGSYTADVVRALCTKDLQKWADQVRNAPLPDLAKNTSFVLDSLKAKQFTIPDQAKNAKDYNDFVGSVENAMKTLAKDHAIADASNYYLGSMVTSGWYKTLAVLLISTLVILPLAMMRDLSKLSKLSIAGMACIAYIAILTVVDFCLDWGKEGKLPSKDMIKAFGDDLKSIFVCISKMVFAFANHFTIVSIVPKMDRPTPARRKALVIVSQAATTLIYVMVSLCAYFHFASKDDLLEGAVNWWYIGGKGAIAATIVLSYPLLLNPARDAAIFLLSGGANSTSVASSMFSLVTIGFVAISALVGAFLYAQVGPIMDIFTSLAGAALAFVFPALYFIRLSTTSRSQDIKDEDPKATVYFRANKFERLISYVVLVLGVVVVCIGTGVAVMNMINDFKDASLKGTLKEIIYGGAGAMSSSDKTKTT